MTTTPPPDNVEARHISPYTTGEKAKRALWGLVQATLFRCSPRTAFRFRVRLLRLFGSRTDLSCHIRNNVTIECPWNLSVGPNTGIGDHAILYCLGSVTIGARCTISQYAHLCAGSHDYMDPHTQLLRPPITLGDDVWIATDAFVGPGVTIGDRTILGARASVFKDLPPDVIAVGNPAKPIKERKTDSTPNPDTAAEK